MTKNQGDDINQCSQQNDDSLQQNEQEEVAELKKTVEQLQKEIDDHKNRWLRSQADFENYRKRTQRDIQEIHLYAGEQLIKDILPVVDNFERALDSIEEKDDSFYKGIELIYQQLKEVMEKHNIKEIEALGKPFDPKYHDAVIVEENEEYEDNTVAEVMLKGYSYHSKVIRPSMVKVVKN